MHKLGRIATTIVSSIAILGAASAITVFTLNDVGAAKLAAETRMYEGKFYSEGSLLYETGPLKKGDLIGFSEMPTKERDPDGGVYQFYGWDIDNNSIPDIIGDRIYFNFTANALFFKIPIPEDFTLTEDQLENLLNLLTNLNLELTPEQIQMIIDILMDMNIDWTDIDQDLLMRILDFLGMDLEDFMNMLGLDFESLLGLLNAPVLSYTASDYTMPVFFRTQSYGDYNKSKWAKGDYYAASNVSEGSVNPLCYSMDKLSKVMSPVSYDITYLKTGKIYPVPAYELNNNQGLNSESHSLENPAPRPSEEYPKATGYTTAGYGFYPASAYTILMMNSESPYTNRAIEADEVKYRDYVYSHYLNVDSKYKTYFQQLAQENDFEPDQFYSYISKINEFFKDFTLYELNIDEMKSYPSGVDKVLYFMQEAKAGLSEHFATATTLLYRSLGIPARYVEGYFDYVTNDTGEARVVGGLQAHSWVEIYIDHIGWMMVDTSISNALPEELSNFLFGAPNVSFDNFEKRTLDHIECSVTKNTYFTGQHFDKEDLTITAYYTNGTDCLIPVSTENNTDTTVQSLTIYIPDNFEDEGTKSIKVIYIENGVPAVAKVPIEVVEPRVTELVVKPDSYQSVYLKDNKLNMDNIAFEATFNDGHKENITKADMTIPTIKTDTIGHFEYDADFNLQAGIKAKIPIDVLAEPVSPLKEIGSKEKSYNVFINQSLKVSALSLTAVYQDNTYRDVNESTGTITITGGDYSKVGTTTASVSYTERGVTKSINVSVTVKRITENVAFYFNLTKTYDGQAFDFDNFIEMVDKDDTSVSVLDTGDRIEVDFTGQQLMEPTDFIDAQQTFFGIRFRIVNANGAAVTDDYLENATSLQIYLNDGNGEPTLDHYPLTRDGEYVNVGVLQFRILPRAITIKTADMYIDSAETRYLVDEYNNLTELTDISYGISISSGSLCTGDEIDFSTVSFNKTYSQVPSGSSGTTNTLNEGAFTIYNSSRNKNVTNNYDITFTKGTLKRLG